MPRERFEKGLFPFWFRRRVQFSLFFFIPLFLILFSLAPTYIAISLMFRAIPAIENVGAADFHGAVVEMSWVFLASGLVALAAGLLIAYALVQPMRRLSEAMRGVTSGDFKANVRLDATGEFVYLGDEFNQMVSKLAMQERFQRTERLAALGTLAAGVAHEVRNPLGAVKGLAQLLCESAASADQKKYAETIAGEVDRLNAVVERLLSLARPSGGAAETIDLNRLIHDAVELSGYQRNGKRIAVREDYDDRIPTIQGDREGLLQTALNILLNAVQAIPETGRIRIRTRLETDPAAPPPRRVRIEIANTHSHVAPEDYRRIFDPFYTTKEHGTGLGLAIAHQAVASHGGAIEVESGRGETVFTIDLPVK